MYPATVQQPAAANCGVSIQISTTMQLYSGVIFYNLKKMYFVMFLVKVQELPEVLVEVISGENIVP